MSTLYFLALCGVCAVVLGVLFDAILGVSRPPRWIRQQPSLTLVPVVETRTQDLSFVSADRRQAGKTPVEEQAERLRA